MTDQYQKKQTIRVKKKKECSKDKHDEETRKKWNRSIKNADRNDYRRWISRWTERIERTDVKGDLKAVYRGVRALNGTKNCFSNTQSTTDSHGQRIKSPEELDQIWTKFLENKLLKQTELKQMHAEYEALSSRSEEDDDITREEFDSAVKKMKK